MPPRRYRPVSRARRTHARSLRPTDRPTDRRWLGQWDRYTYFYIARLHRGHDSAYLSLWISLVLVIVGSGVQDWHFVRSHLHNLPPSVIGCRRLLWMPSLTIPRTYRRYFAVVPRPAIRRVVDNSIWRTNGWPRGGTDSLWLCVSESSREFVVNVDANTNQKLRHDRLIPMIVFLSLKAISVVEQPDCSVAIIIG